jgi:hypothetical protein
MLPRWIASAASESDVMSNYLGTQVRSSKVFGTAYMLLTQHVVHSSVLAFKREELYGGAPSWMLSSTSTGPCVCIPRYLGTFMKGIKSSVGQ